MAETQKEFNFKIHGKTYKPAILDNDTLYVPDKNINPALKPEEATYSDIDNAFPSDYFFSELIKGELDTLDDLNVIENPNYMDTYFIKSEGRYYRCDEDGYFYPWVKTLDGLTEDDIIHALGYAPLSEADMNVIYDEIDNIFNSELPDVIKGSKASMSALNSLTDSVPGDIWFVVSEGKYYKFSIDGNWSEWSTVRSAITKEDLGLGNVENKSSETIRNEITSDDVVHALGFKPLTDEVNFDFESIRNELAGKVNKSGNKVLTDNNLSDELKGKYDDVVNKAHTHSNKNILDKTTESFTTEKNNKINTNETNISMLAKHINGDLLDSDFAEDSEAVMTKTVPSGMSDYAAVKMIGGYTRKTVNLFDINGEVNEQYNGSQSTHNTVANGNVTPSAIAQNVHGYGQRISVKPNTSYVISTKNIGTATGIIRFYPNLNKADVYNMLSVEPSGERISKTINSDKFNSMLVTFECSQSTGAVFSEIQFEEGTTATPYEPYGELWNTPVESVVSVGKNIAEFSSMTEKTKMNIYGAIEKGKFLKAGKYTLSYQSDYTAFLQVWLVDNMTQIVKDGSAKTITFTLPSDGKYSIYFYKDTTSNGGLANANIRNLQLEKSNEATPYSQHFKTTLLIPDSIKNLPDYGVEGNVIDFENMVYRHNNHEYVIPSEAKWYEEKSNVFYITGVTPLMKDSAWALINGYTNVTNYTDMLSNDKTVWVGNSAGRIYIHDSSIATTTDCATLINGKRIVYKLATPEVIDISDILHPIRCESGGTITFNNEHSLDVPNIVVYKKEVSLS